VPFWFVACLYAWEVCVIDWNWVHVFLVVGLNGYSVAWVWTVARAVNLAQASSSRLGESVWDPPRFYSSSSPRRKALVFERCVVSLRREYLAQASSRRGSWCALFAASSRRGVLFLGEGRSHPGELISPKRDARRVPCSRPRLGEMA